MLLWGMLAMRASLPFLHVVYQGGIARTKNVSGRAAPGLTPPGSPCSWLPLSPCPVRALTVISSQRYASPPHGLCVAVGKALGGRPPRHECRGLHPCSAFAH